MNNTGITPGIVVVPLNLPGPEYEGLTLTYDFKELIGAGGFGEMWRTRCRGTGDWLENATRVSFEIIESDRGRLALAAAKAVIRQPRHPHICSIRSVIGTSGRLWVGSELAEGNMAELAAGVNRGPALKRYIREAAAGLDHLHGCGLVHNRVKPSNILIFGGRAQLSDFDLVHPLQANVTSERVVKYGDRAFLAPEVLAGRLCLQSDQFSLACAYIEVRLGSAALVGGVSQCPALAELVAGERAALLRALSANPEDRFPNCRAFADALAASEMHAPDSLTWHIMDAMADDWESIAQIESHVIRYHGPVERNAIVETLRRLHGDSLVRIMDENGCGTDSFPDVPETAWFSMTDAGRELWDIAGPKYRDE